MAFAWSRIVSCVCSVYYTDGESYCIYENTYLNNIIDLRLFL